MLHIYRSLVCSLLLLAVVLAGCNAGRRSQPDAVVTAPAALSPAQARAQSLSDQGKELKKEGFTAQALDAFTEAIQENPKLTEAHLSIGDIFREMAAYEKADTAYRKAVVSDPNNFDARYLLGLTSHLSGDLQRAIASYKRALVINKNSYEANREMGSAMMQSGKLDEAIKFTKRAVQLNPESQPGWANLAAAYSLTGDYENAVDAYRQTLALGDAAIPVLLGLANAHIQLGNYPRAENVLHAIEREGGSPIAQERMGLVLFKQQKFLSASQAYRKVLADQPNDTASLNGLGISLMARYLRGGEEDDKLRVEALALWGRSISLRPEQGKIIDLLSRYTHE